MADTPKAQKPYVIWLVATVEWERRELVEALQSNRLSHKLHVMSDCNQLLEHIKAQHDGPHADCPNLILLSIDAGKVTVNELLELIKNEPELQAVPVIPFTRPGRKLDTTLAYKNGAASVIPLPLKFEGLVRVMRIMEEYWFDVARPPQSP